MDLTYPYKIDL